MCIHHPPTRLPSRPMTVYCLALAESSPPSSSSSSRLLLLVILRPALDAGLSHRRLLIAVACHRAVPFPNPMPLSAPSVPQLPVPFSSRIATALASVAYHLSRISRLLRFRCVASLFCAPPSRPPLRPALCPSPLSPLFSLSFSPIPSLCGSSLLSARHACPSRVACVMYVSRLRSCRSYPLKKFSTVWASALSG